MNAAVGFVQLLFWACIGVVSVLTFGAGLVFLLFAGIGYGVYKLVFAGKSEIRLK